MTPHRLIVAFTVTIAWIMVVGIAWVFFGGTQIPQCFMGAGPAAQVAYDACAAKYFAAHPPPPLADAPLFWLAVIAVGVGVIWTLARRQGGTGTA